MFNLRIGPHWLYETSGRGPVARDTIQTNEQYTTTVMAQTKETYAGEFKLGNCDSVTTAQVKIRCHSRVETAGMLHMEFIR